jgi:hypothetical protein
MYIRVYLSKYIYMYIMSKYLFTLHNKLNIIGLWDSPESNAS